MAEWLSVKSTFRFFLQHRAIGHLFGREWSWCRLFSLRVQVGQVEYVALTNQSNSEDKSNRRIRLDRELLW